MLKAAKILTVINVIVKVIVVFPLYYTLDGPFGIIYAIIQALLYIIFGIYCFSEMHEEVRSAAVIPLSFIFVGVLVGICYSIWFADSANKVKTYETNPEAEKVHWRCSSCGNEVKFVNHCICGHDYDSSLDEYIETKPSQNTKKGFVVCQNCGIKNQPSFISCISCGCPLHAEKQKLEKELSIL